MIAVNYTWFKCFVKDFYSQLLAMISMSTNNALLPHNILEVQLESYLKEENNNF